MSAGSATNNSKKRLYGGSGQYCSATPVANAVPPGLKTPKSGWPAVLGMKNFNDSAIGPT